MTRTLAAALLTATLALGGCANWKALSPDQQAQLITAGTRALIKPQCSRLDELGPEYAGLCEEAIEDGLLAARAGLIDDWSLLCGAIGEKATHCSLIPGASAHDLATCQSALLAAEALCDFSFASDE
jgi:hypothetical protein